MLGGAPTAHEVLSVTGFLACRNHVILALPQFLDIGVQVEHDSGPDLIWVSAQAMTFDIVIHGNERFLAANEQLRISKPPVQAKCQLGSHLWVGRIDHAIAKAVMDLCDSVCVGTLSPVRQFAQLYAFVRELPEDTLFGKWDEENSLKDCMGLSRLIRPTSTGFNYAARVHVDEYGRPTQLCRAQISGINIEAYVSPSEERDWLTETEAVELKGLLSMIPTVQPPERLSNALWYHEFAFRTWFADVRWTLVCTALEALLNTSEYQNKKQFSSRVPRLAAELGLLFGEDEAKTAYAVRSKLAHGEAFLYALPQVELRIYDQMEEVLRTCILCAYRDASFAQVFHSADSVANRWPI